MLYTHYCTVGKYSLTNPSPLFFLGGFSGTSNWSNSFSRRLAILPPFLPPYYSPLLSQPSHLNVVSASPVIILGDLDFQFSFFVLFQGGVLFTTRVYYVPIRITPFSDTRKRERARQEEDQKKKDELPRVCRIRTKTHIHTYIPPYVHT